MLKLTTISFIELHFTINAQCLINNFFQHQRISNLCFMKYLHVMSINCGGIDGTTQASHSICRLGDFQGGPRQVSPQGFRGCCGYSVAMV